MTRDTFWADLVRSTNAELAARKAARAASPAGKISRWKRLAKKHGYSVEKSPLSNTIYIFSRRGKIRVSDHELPPDWERETFGLGARQKQDFKREVIIA